MTVQTNGNLELLKNNGQEAAMTDQQRRRLAQDRLIIWRLAQDNGISENMLAVSGNSREHIQRFISHNDTEYQEFRYRKLTSDLVSLEDMFEIGRMRVAEMLVTVEKPSELKVLISTLGLLPGGKALLAGKGKKSVAAESPAVPDEVPAASETDSETAEPAPATAETHAPETDSTDSADAAVQATKPAAEAASDSVEQTAPLKELQRLQTAVQDATLSRQQRRQLERRIDKLREAQPPTAPPSEA